MYATCNIYVYIWYIHTTIPQMAIYMWPNGQNINIWPEMPQIKSMHKRALGKYSKYASEIKG